MKFAQTFKNKLATSLLVMIAVEVAVIPFGGLSGGVALASSCPPLADSNGLAGNNIYNFPTEVGGVSLDVASQFLADMTDVTGAYFDQATNRIVFVGKTDTPTPQYNKDDMSTSPFPGHQFSFICSLFELLGVSRRARAQGRMNPFGIVVMDL